MSSVENIRHADGITPGLRLLEKFQDQWVHIHAKSEENVIKANLALTKLKQIEHKSSTQLEALDALLTNYRSIPKLDEQLKNIENDLLDLHSYFVKIEDSLSALKARKERVESANQLRRLEVQCDDKIRELEQLSDSRKERLKNEHLKRVEEIEEEQERKLDERRLVLAKAFEEEKSRYLEQVQANFKAEESDS